MKTNFFAALILAGAALFTAGCVRTVSGTHAWAMVPGQDRFVSRYRRPMNEVYAAAKTVVQNDGVLLTEYIPHESTNSVRALQAQVNQRHVWISVERLEPDLTQVEVEARTKWGGRDLDLAHELDKEIAIQLTR